MQMKAVAANDAESDELPAWLRCAPTFTQDPLAAARALRPIIEAGAAQGERERSIPEPVVRAIAASGLWGILVPRELGGTEADPGTYIDVIEELSYADGSTGWVMLTTTFGISGAAIWLGPAALEAMYHKGSGFICAGQIAPTGKAARVEGGYRVSGTFQFGSGARVASYFFGAFVLQKDGKPELSPEGRPKMIWAFAPRSKIRLKTETWDVMGLVATASYDFEFVEQFIADDYVMFPFERTRRGGPFYEIGVSIAHVSWALGVGVRILDEIKALASRKRRPGRVTLIDQPTFQRDFAQSYATMQAARAYVRSAFNGWFEARVQARLASCWATEIAAKVGSFAYLAAGSDGLRNEAGENRLQRCFRDLQAGCIHKHVDHNVLIDCGAVLLGVADPKLEI
jgi:alkylation response protein AidB-like acyl-CoA dehydrogenase